MLEFTEVWPRICLGVLGAKIPWSEFFPCFHVVSRVGDFILLPVSIVELPSREHVADCDAQVTTTLSCMCDWSPEYCAHLRATFGVFSLYNLLYSLQHGTSQVYKRIFDDIFQTILIFSFTSLFLSATLCCCSRAAKLPSDSFFQCQRLFSRTLHTHPGPFNTSVAPAPRAQDATIPNMTRFLRCNERHVHDRRGTLVHSSCPVVLRRVGILGETWGPRSSGKGLPEAESCFADLPLRRRDGGTYLDMFVVLYKVKKTFSFRRCCVSAGWP
jgi:hypothetical protein